MSRKRESGAFYRKMAKDKIDKEEEVMRKMPKMQSFFKKQNVKEREGNASDNNEILIEQPSTSTANIELQCNDILVSGAIESNVSHDQSILVEPDKSDMSFGEDPALWVISKELQHYFISHEIKQNLEMLDFQKSKREYNDRVRYCSKGLFETKLKNNEVIARDWLIYSHTTGNVYCLPCCLFNRTGSFSTTGFNDWKNSHLIGQHENSQNHKNCILTLLQRQNEIGQVNTLHAEQYKREVEYWREVLKRVVAAIKALATRGLPFRGSNEVFGDPEKGNYMMILELLAEFDPFLAEHIKNHGNPGRGNTSYLSSTICEEIIALMAEEVLKAIEKEIEEAKYYSISVDSTPDITHTDQLSFITRLVKMDGQPVERFLGFIANPGHKAAELYEAVIKMMEKNNFIFNNCRGQSYDNAANMSGIYSGLQARLLEICKWAYFIPCAAHSLNLVGEHAVGCCKASREFFALLQQVYVSFASSTSRWMVLQKHLTGKSVKKLSATRWSARSDACSSLNENWEVVIAALTEIEEDITLKATIRNEATSLIKRLKSLETAILFAMWSPILSRFDKVSESLQRVDIGLDEVIELYNSLIEYIENLRNEFNQFEEIGLKNSGLKKYRDEGRRPQRRPVPADESREGDVNLTPRENFRVYVYLATMDRLSSELIKRRNAYKEFVAKFSFLLNLQNLGYDQIKAAAVILVNNYPDDLDNSLVDECIHFEAYISQIENPPKTLLDISTFIRSEQRRLVQVFPYLDITVRMFLCTFATNCSAERSFSALKRIKTYLRACMNQDRLVSLAILCIESKLCKDLDFELILQKFAEKKARKQSFR